MEDISLYNDTTTPVVDTKQNNDTTDTSTEQNIDTTDTGTGQNVDSRAGDEGIVTNIQLLGKNLIIRDSSALAIINELNSDIAVLKSRMDEFASLPAGSTEGNAELADIRVGFNGKTYSSAGNAVRDQIILCNKWLGLLKLSEDHPTLSTYRDVGVYGASAFIDFPDYPAEAPHTNFTLKNERAFNGNFTTQYLYTINDLKQYWIRVLDSKGGTYINWTWCGNWNGLMLLSDDTPLLSSFTEIGVYGVSSYVDFPDYPADAPHTNFTLRNERAFNGQYTTQYLYTINDLTKIWTRTIKTSSGAIYIDWVSNKNNIALTNVAFCGDSFTAPTATDSSYVNFLIDNNICQGRNFGISGATPGSWFAEHENDITNDYDIYFLAFGLNADVSGTGSPDSTDPNTFAGGLNTIINKIHDVSPKARIIVWCMDAWFSQTKMTTAQTISMRQGCEFYAMKNDPKIPVRLQGKYEGVMPGLSTNVVSLKTAAYESTVRPNHPNYNANKMLATYLANIL